MHRIRRLVLIPPAIALAALLLPCPGCTPGLPDGGDSNPGVTFNNPPQAQASADVSRGIVPLRVQFDSSRSTDPGGYIASRQWDFGDGTTATEIAPAHTFSTSGKFTVTLTVTDNQGATATDSLVISATQAPVAVLEADSLSAEFAPATLSFNGSNSYDPDPDGSIAAYLWDFGDGAQEAIGQVQHTFSRPGNFRVRLTVTDNIGVKSFAERVVVIGIGKPVISFRIPDDSVTNIALSREAPLWIAATYHVEPGTPYTISAGLDLDRDACDAQAAVYDPETGDLLHRLLGAEQPVRTAAFSPDGILMLLAGDDGQIRLYDIDNGIELVTIDSGASGVNALTFSPDGSRYICGGSDGSVVLRDTYSGQILRSFLGHPGFPVNCVAFSPAGRFAASGGEDSAAMIWDTLTGNYLRLDASVGGHTAAVNSVAFSPVNLDYLATGSADGTAKIWQLSRIFPLLTCAGHTDEVTSVAFSFDGQFLATGSLDKSAALWNIATGAAAPTAVFSEFEAGVTCLAFSPDRLRLLIGGADGSARIFDLATKVEVQTLQPCSSEISSACYNTNGDAVLLAVAAQNGIGLDTIEPGGGDLNVRVPAGLDLSTLTDDEVPGQFYVWVALDTDVTEPVRAYAKATVQVVNSATDTISADTPAVPLVGQKAVIVAAPTPARQIFDLGPLHRGDQLKLSLAAMPGYTPLYDDERYSILVLDSAQSMFAWYQNPGPYWDDGALNWPGNRVELSSSDVLIIGHDSAHYYLVLDGCTREVCDDEYLTTSVCVEVVPEVGLIPREQRVLLSFDTAHDDVLVWDDHVDIPVFDAQDLNAAWGAAETAEIKSGVQGRLEQIFSGYNVSFFQDASVAPPYVRVTFGGGGEDSVYAWTDYLDPRNQTRSGQVYVLAEKIAAEYPDLTASQMAIAMANVAGQQIGLLLGLRNSASGIGVVSDIMDPQLTTSSGAISSTGPRFINSLLNSDEQFNGSIGRQNAPELLMELVGND